MTSLLENSIVAGKTENYLIKKLIMPSSIFTRCLLFKEISEFCLNPVWSIEISFRIAQIFLLLIKSDQRQIFYGFLYIVPIILFSVIYNIPKFLEVRHHRHGKGNTALVICTLCKQWKHCHRRNVMSYRFKSILELFSLVWLLLLFFFYFNFFDYSCTSWKFDPVPPSPPLSSVNKTFCGSTCTSWKFGHRMAPLTLIENLGTIAKFTSIKS